MSKKTKKDVEEVETKAETVKVEVKATKKKAETVKVKIISTFVGKKLGGKVIIGIKDVTINKIDYIEVNIGTAKFLMSEEELERDTK